MEDIIMQEAVVNLVMFLSSVFIVIETIYRKLIFMQAVCIIF